MPVSLTQKKAYVANTQPIFSLVKERFGIAPRIALVQSALESNWGISELATAGLNIFSITPGEDWIDAMVNAKSMDAIPTWSTNGHPVVYFPTKEYSKYPPEKIRYWEIPGDIVSKVPDGAGGSLCVVNRYFRKYVSWSECAGDWGGKLASEPRYADAFEDAKAGNLAGFAHEIVASGYVTDPVYATELINTNILIEQMLLDPPPAAPSTVA